MGSRKGCLVGATVGGHYDPNDNADDDQDTFSQYKLLHNINAGSFGRVIKARHKSTRQSYAVKDVDMAKVREMHMEFTIKREKRAGRCLFGCPFLIKTYSAFVKDDHCYFIMELADNGQLSKLLEYYRGFSLAVTRFYSAQIVMALEFLRQKQWVHRDLASKNILLDQNFHIKIADFGLAKKVGEPPGRLGNPGHCTEVGTLRIISPEVIKRDPTTCSSDLWALGVNIYEMITNEPCFKDQVYRHSKHRIHARILKAEYKPLPPDTDVDVVDIINSLIVVNPTYRLGNIGMGGLKSHPFFTGIRWDTLTQQLPPPFDNSGVPNPITITQLTEPTPPPPGTVLPSGARIPTYPPKRKRKPTKLSTYWKPMNCPPIPEDLPPVLAMAKTPTEKIGRTTSIISQDYAAHQDRVDEKTPLVAGQDPNQDGGCDPCCSVQ